MIKNAKYSVGNDLFPKSLSEMLYIIWYHWHNLKNVKNTQEGVLLLVKLQALTLNFTKRNTPLWEFFTFFKLHKLYQIAQSTKNIYIKRMLISKIRIRREYDEC